MRIVIDGRYINDAFPGIGRYTYNLIVSLAELGTGDALIVLANSRLPNQRYDMSRLGGLPGCKIEDCRVDRFLPSELLGLASVVRRLRPDVFHSPYYLRPYPLAAPCIHTIHDLIPLEVPEEFSWIDRMVFRLAAPMACRKAAAVLTISEPSACALRRWYPPLEGRIHVTPLAPDPQFRPLPADQRSEAVRRSGLAGIRYVLHVSSGLPHKNVELLLLAWDRYVRRRPQARHRLALAGNYGRRQAEIVAFARRLEARDSICFLGDIDDSTLAGLYNSADLFVFPAAIEGFGLPVIEAMACGAPVLTTDRVSAAAALGDAGWAIPADSLESLVNALDRLLGDGELRRTLARRGLAHAASYSWQTTARETWRVYREAAIRGRL
jgi:glycosyltransferase involved in cell wall biosynthesis